MTAPLKPWERAGVNSRAFGGDFANSLPVTTAPAVMYVNNFSLTIFIFATIGFVYFTLVGVEAVPQPLAQAMVGLHLYLPGFQAPILTLSLEEPVAI